MVPATIRKSGLSLWALALLLAAALSAPGFQFGVSPAKAQIQEGGGDGKIKVDLADLLGPVQDSVSGPLWLAAQGLDPRLLTHPAGPTDALSGFQAPRGQGGGGVLVPFRDPAPAFSRDILLTRDFGGSPFQTEPSLAIDPFDAEHVVVGAIDFNFPAVVAYTTFDGGETWEGPVQTPFLRDDLVGAGDPVVRFDSEGNVFMISISLGLDDFTIGNFELTAVVSSIAIVKSEDGGLTWDDAISTSRSGVSTNLQLDLDQRARGQVFLSFLDKPWIDIGPDPEDPEKEIFYVTYTDFNVVTSVLYLDELPVLATQEVQSTIRAVTSRDGGRTWSDTVDISPTVRRISGNTPAPGTGQTTGLKRVVQGSSPKVAPDGTAYVAWMDSTDDESQEGLGEIYIARSDDGGDTWTRPMRATVFGEPGFRPRSAFFRYWASAFPQMAISPDGAVNIVYVGLNADDPVDDGDVFYMRSTDRGENFTQPRELGGDRSSSLQFFPAMDIDEEGVIHVMWGDTRDSREQAKYHIYYTTSEDDGETWGFVDEELRIRSDDTRVTDFPSNPNNGFPFGLFIGDYFGIEAMEGEVYMVWADTRLGEFGPINQKIGFSRRRAIPSPEVFISPPTGPGGQEVTVQGFNLQPDLNVFVLVGGSIITNERVNAEGRFTTRVFMPVSGQGAQNVRILDESGNVATTSFFTEFGFGDIRERQDSLAVQLEAISGGDVLRQLEDLQGQLENIESGGGTAWWVIFLATLGGSVLAVVLASVITLRFQGRRRA